MKKDFLKIGIFTQICNLIRTNSNLDSVNSNQNISISVTNNLRCKKGIGYRYGSTNNIELAVETRYTREVRLTWLLRVFTIFIWGNDNQLLDVCCKNLIELPEFAKYTLFYNQIFKEELEKNKTILLDLLQYLKNDSVFDISKHVEFYEVIRNL